MMPDCPECGAACDSPDPDHVPLCRFYGRGTELLPPDDDDEGDDDE